jgi:phosphoribosylformylglycinamidine synthase II
MPIDPTVLERHGLKPDEYERIVRSLQREPSLTELGIFSVMWSEHCSYKSSRVHLRKLPTEGPRVLQGPGENAGAVDIGDGLAAVFKIESHNHPSFIEPYQGAATGVGGIIRDIFTMGARPIALMNSLRFGEMEGPDGPRTRRIVEGVVAGIAGYGNSIGIPTVGGEITFDDRYAANPLVNVFCLGIAHADALVKGNASGIGNPVYYVGSKTGRDGIHGATMASAEFDEKSAEKRPAVQVGDPFMEKLLLEACLELMQTDALIGVQDMGAAGLTCSTCEMGSRGGAGIEIDVMHVPQRETGMTPYEIMLSESQERMLLVVKKGREAEVERIFDKWDLHAAHIGSVTGDGLMRVKDHGTVVAEIPNSALVDAAPVYNRPTSRPAYLDEVQKFDPSSLPGVEPEAALFALLGSPTVASKRWVYRQYDHMVRTNTIVLAGMGAGVVRIKGTSRAIAMSVDGNGRYCYLDPRRGAMLAVAEAARNVACAGATPIGATNCLNFGNPERPEIMWQLVEAIEGIADACRALDVPITGGNVSLYNETNGEAIYPTPVIGVVGVMDDASKVVARAFKGEGDEIIVLGENFGELGGSEYLKALHGLAKGQPPQLDLTRVRCGLAAVRTRLFGWGHCGHRCRMHVRHGRNGVRGGPAGSHRTGRRFRRRVAGDGNALRRIGVSRGSVGASAGCRRRDARGR